MTMAKQTNERTLAREMDAMLHPLARALGNIRATLSGWDEADIRNALAVMTKHSPTEFDDPNLCEAECILRTALLHARAENIAKSAQPICIDVAFEKGRWTLFLEDGDVMTTEFASFDEAKAAGDAISAFLELAGRAGAYCHQTHAQHPKPGARLDDTVPF